MPVQVGSTSATCSSPRTSEKKHFENVTSAAIAAASFAAAGSLIVGRTKQAGGSVSGQALAAATGGAIVAVANILSEPYQSKDRRKQVDAYFDNASYAEWIAFNAAGIGLFAGIGAGAMKMLRYRICAPPVQSAAEAATGACLLGAVFSLVAVLTHLKPKDHRFNAAQQPHKEGLLSHLDAEDLEPKQALLDASVREAH